MAQFTNTLHDQALLQQYDYVIGLDEVGRGCVAGPIFAGAVAINAALISQSNNMFGDSKLINEKLRKNAVQHLITHQYPRALASRSAAQVDQLGIQPCNTEIFTQVANEVIQQVLALNPSATYIIQVDGLIDDIGIPCTALIKGESKSVAIAAASILAKVSRDQYMVDIDPLYPQYGFKKHKGYGTAQHLEAIKNSNVCVEHRRSFLKNYLP